MAARETGWMIMKNLGFNVIIKGMEGDLMLYCPHCDEFHPDSELTILAELDYVECNITGLEIKTWKFTDSKEAIAWRKEHDFPTI